ncbi:MAG: gliding motility-associated C-terminal domain-containing protein [Bacteroidales bacterium]
MAWLVGLPLRAQEEGNHWYFGNRAGLDFSDYFPMPVTSGSTASQGGTASVSDAGGALLFYTDGATVWDRNHQIMKGIQNLTGDPDATHAATIVPSPRDPKKYFIFTTRVWDPQDPDNWGGNYYIVDFSANPLGEVIYDHSQSGHPGILRQATEKLLVVPVTGVQEPAWWIIMHEFNSNRFALFQLTETLQFVDFKAVGSVHENGPDDDGQNRGAKGQIKASMKGDKIAVAIEGQKKFEYFTFNARNGTITRRTTMPAGDAANKATPRYGAYGVEFSEDGLVLYGSSRSGGMIYQWDLQASTQENMIKNSQILGNNAEFECGSMQIGPNGKIYIAFNGQDYLGVINNPNLLFQRADYQKNGARLFHNDEMKGGTCGYGLPAANPALTQALPFYFRNTCMDSTTSFHITDPSQVSAATFRFRHLETGEQRNEPVNLQTSRGDGTPVKLSQPGEYEVTLTVTRNNMQFHYTRNLTIYPNPVVKLTELETTPLCRGAVLELDAGLAAFYEWDDESLKERHRLVGDWLMIYEKQDFRVKVVDYHGCLGWDTVWVRRIPSPTVTVSTIPAFCRENNGSAIVTPNGNLGNFRFDWEHDSTLTLNRLTDVAGGHYSVTVTDKTTLCSSLIEVEVPKLGGGDVQIQADIEGPVCPGTPVVLTATNCEEIHWLTPSGLTSREITVYPQHDTIFRVRGIAYDDARRPCESEDEIQILVLPTITPNLGDDRMACRGDTVRIEVEGDFLEWSWSNNLSGPSILLTGEEIGLTLFVRDSNQCITSSTVNVIFNLPPDLTVETTKALWGQSNGTISINPEGRLEDYALEWLEYPDQTGPRLENLEGGLYHLRLLSLLTGCDTLATIRIDVLGAKTVQLKSSEEGPTCPGAPVTLTASGTDLYEWIIPAGAIGPEVTVRPEEETTYRVRGITLDELGNRCFDIQEITVPVHPSVKPNLGTLIEACEGEVLVVDGQEGYLEWHWSNERTGRYIELTESVNNLILNVVDQFHCELSTTVDILFNPLPEVDLGPDRSVCASDPITLNGGEGSSWLWNDTWTTREIQIASSGTYWLKITDKGCSQSDTVDIQIHHPEDFRLELRSVNDVSCFGGSDGSVLLEAEGPAGRFYFSIDDGETYSDNGGHFQELIANDHYLIRVLTDSICSIPYPFPVAIRQPEEISVRHRTGLATCRECRDGILELTEITGGHPPYTVAWSNSQSGLRADGLEPGNHSATITDQLGCTRVFDFEMSVKTDIPNAFTPNGRQGNETWVIRFLDFYPEASVRIFDSFGQLVFSKDGGYSPDQAWDGKMNGKPLPTGTYYYLIRLSPIDKPITGSLTLLR